MTKYLVVLAAGVGAALLSALLGVAVMELRSGHEARRATDAEEWSLGPVAVRGEESYRRAADGFRERYRWLVPPKPKDNAADVAAAAAAEAAKPRGPDWLFVGVLLESSEQVALVAEAGRVNRYRIGDAFGNGTRLLAMTEQSIRVSEAGTERTVLLYRR